MVFSFMAQATSPGTSGLLGFLPFILIMVVVYFLMLRPQMKKQKDHARMVAELRKGDDVVTAGGVHGRIVHAIEKESTVQVQIARGVVITIERGSIARRASSVEASFNEGKVPEQRAQKSEGGVPQKEIWGNGQASSAVVTSGSRSSVADAMDTTNISSAEPGARRSRHRRFRRRKPGYQGSRESGPSGNPPTEQSG